MQPEYWINEYFVTTSILLIPASLMEVRCPGHPKVISISNVLRMKYCPHGCQ
jgi:hypothetical protein